MSTLNLARLTDTFIDRYTRPGRRDAVKLATAAGALVVAAVLLVRFVVGGGPAGISDVFAALSLEDADAVRRAIESDRDALEEVDPDGNTPLHVAVLTGSEPLTRTLLDAGADPNVPNRDGWTPLALAVIADRNQAPVARQLVEAGAKTDHVLPDGQTLLHVAAATPGVNASLLAVLAPDPASLARRDSRGKLPIDVARERRQEKVVLALSKLSASSPRRKAN